MTAMRAKGASQPETTAYYRDLCEQMALTIHVHEKALDEYAATVLTRDKRIAVLEARLAEFETSFDRRTRQLRSATLERLQRGM